MHGESPKFLFDVLERLEFTQVMGVAQGVDDALNGKTGFPVIVRDDADHVRQPCAAFGRGAMESQKNRRRHMQPLGDAANPAAQHVSG
jgi:hypothetical protein